MARSRDESVLSVDAELPDGMVAAQSDGAAEITIPKPVRVLLIEDDEDDFILVRDMLSSAAPNAFKLNWASDYDEGLRKLKNGDVDACLLDFLLGRHNGVELLDEVPEIRQHVPIIVLTALNEDDFDDIVLQKGAAGYLSKATVDASRLIRSLRYAIANQAKVDAANKYVDDLNQANEKLRSQYRATHDFVDQVAHEFRTPLAVIRELSAMALEALPQDSDQEQRENLEDISGCAEDMTSMIDDMLDFSRLEAGLLTVERQECSVDEIFEHIQPIISTKAATKQINLLTATAPSLPLVYCDPEKIGRVITNLVVNASKFSDPGSQIVIKAEASPHRHEVAITVTDEGRGIPPQKLNSIFDQFSRIDGDGGEKIDGFGLGLGIAKELTNVNFGEINVTSTVGVGTTFTVTVPTFDPYNLVERLLERIAQAPEQGDHLSIVSASIGAPADGPTLQLVETFLQHQFHRYDILLRKDASTWILAVVADWRELARLIARVSNAQATLRSSGEVPNLPSITLHQLGTWHHRDGRSEILDTVAAELMSVGDDRIQ